MPFQIIVIVFWYIFRFVRTGLLPGPTHPRFFAGMRITAMRQMILASDTRDRKEALHRLLFMQREDMTELFQIMEGQPVTIRLFDPPLHEFLPNTEAELSYVARAAGVPVDRVRRRASELNEANPMLGHRGCRGQLARCVIVVCSL